MIKTENIIEEESNLPFNLQVNFFFKIFNN